MISLVLEKKKKSWYFITPIELKNAWDDFIAMNVTIFVRGVDEDEEEEEEEKGKNKVNITTNVMYVYKYTVDKDMKEEERRGKRREKEKISTFEFNIQSDRLFIQ